MKMQRTPKLNIDKQQLNNKISKNIDKNGINQWYIRVENLEK